MIGALDKITIMNKNYRHVLYTTTEQQLVVMSLNEGEEIGMEKHPHTTQFIKIEKGEADVIIKGKKFKVSKGDCVIVNKNIYHNIIAITPLKLYTIYSPPEHPKGLIEKIKP